jgi:hypothetical protein
MTPAPRVVIALKPRMYAEALAFSVRLHRPHARVSILEPSADLEAETRRIRPHLVVANVVGPGAREAASSWVEVARPGAGEGPKRLGAQMGADGYRASVEDVRTEHVLAVLEQAEASGAD